jgi:hypothetical protein
MEQMKDIFLIIMFSIIIGMFLSGKVSLEHVNAELIMESRSNNPKTCQIFREWKVNNRRVGCCTDDRSTPLTLCIDEYGNEIKEIKKNQFTLSY